VLLEVCAAAGSAKARAAAAPAMTSDFMWTSPWRHAALFQNRACSVGFRCSAFRGCRRAVARNASSANM
jgi:hypothetical protein